MTPAEIDAYVASGEPDDNAGSYALQGIGGLFVARVEGSPSNVVGLPVRLLYTLAAELGVDLARSPSDPEGGHLAGRVARRCREHLEDGREDEVRRPARGADAHLDPLGERALALAPRAERLGEARDLQLAAVEVRLDEEREELVVLPAEEVVRQAEVREERVRDRPDGVVDGAACAPRTKTSQFARTIDSTERTEPCRRERSTSRSTISSKNARV